MSDHHHHDESDEQALRTEALESLLVEKGLVEPERIDELVRRYEEEIGPMNGARVVARAWIDPEYKARLLADARAAIQELGIDPPEAEKVQVLENTPDTHHVVVCTLCSCYPWAVLGLPPSWYKEPAYRSRVVREPRVVLREFGLELDPATEVRVVDSSAEMRYMVLPLRPTGTESWSEEQLREIVSRDSMIGVARVEAPEEGA